MQTKQKIKIAIDAMGGDAGIKTVVEGVAIALKKNSNLNVILVGNESEIKKALLINKIDKYLSEPARIEIKATTEVIESDDPPALVLRNKKGSSMHVSIELVRDGLADACVSAGNTGALMALSRYILKMLSGINRPALCTAVPNKYGSVHWLDLGSNINCDAKKLVQFAVMGSALCNVVDEQENPKVGLLNIGSEDIKGSDEIKEAAAILQELPMNYIGFVEGNDIYNGEVDVVACDGFVGNVALKASEGLAVFIKNLLKEKFKRNIFTMFLGLMLAPIFKGIINKINPDLYNGATLLGLNGIVIKSHGGANAFAFANAIKIAHLEAKKQLPAKIEKLLSQYELETIEVKSKDS